MRILLIALILLAIGGFLFAEEETAEDVPGFSLLSADSYSFDMSIWPEMQRLYVNAELSFNPARITDVEYYSLFLNKDVRFEQISVNGMRFMPFKTTGLVPEHFEPVFSMPEVLQDTLNVICYSFALHGFRNQASNIDIKMRYWIPWPEFVNLDSASQYLEYLPTGFWFPRNLEFDNQVSLKLSTSTRYQLEIGDITPFSDAEGIRTHSLNYTENPLRINPFKLIRTLN